MELKSCVRPFWSGPRNGGIFCPTAGPVEVGGRNAQSSCATAEGVPRTLAKSAVPREDNPNLNKMEEILFRLARIGLMRLLSFGQSAALDATASLLYGNFSTSSVKSSRSSPANRCAASRRASRMRPIQYNTPSGSQIMSTVRLRSPPRLPPRPTTVATRDCGMPRSRK